MEKLKYTLSYSGPTVHGTKFLSFQKRTQNRTAGFCLEEKQLIYGFGEKNLARRHPKLHVLTFEITLKGWERREHCTVNSAVSRHDRPSPSEHTQIR